MENRAALRTGLQPASPCNIAGFTVDASLGPDFTLEITSDGSRFEPAAIARMLKQFELILLNMLSHPDATLSELYETLDESERQQKLRKEQELKETRRQKLKEVTHRTLGHFN